MSASSSSERGGAAATSTVGRALLDALADHGARALFGIPGDFVLPLFREARRWGRLPILGLAHEPTVGFAADAAPEAIARVPRSCREHSRPVYLEVPRDLVDAACEPVVARGPTPWSAEAVREVATRTLARLRAAERPILLVDVEVRRFGLEPIVGALAARWSLPIVTTFSGRGLMATHPGLVGSWLGGAGDASIDALVGQSDLVLGLGILHSDVNLGATVGLDARRLVDARDGLVHPGDASWPAPLPAFVAALNEAEPAVAASARTPIARSPIATGLPADGAPVPRTTSRWRSTICSRRTARCRSPPTSATASSRRAASPPPPSSRRRTTRPWAMRSPRRWA